MERKRKVAERLRNARGEKTIRQVAKDCGISPSAVAMYERAERTPKDDVKIVLANYYGTSVEDLFFAQ